MNFPVDDNLTLRHLKSVVAIGAFLLLWHGISSTEAVPLSVIAPPDKSALTSQLISVVIATDDGTIDDIQVFVDNRKQRSVRRAPDKKIICIDGIPLSVGINKIRIAALKGKTKVEEKNLSVMVRQDLSSNWSTNPAGYGDYTFHGGSMEKNCLPCHRLDFKNAPQDPDKAEHSPCFACHKKMMDSYRVVHGPAAVWSCLMCHNGGPSKGKGNPLEADAGLCVECHDESMSQWKAKKFVHGPMSDGSCVTCHTPHASDQKSLVRLPVVDLCISCHTDVITKPHIISGYSGKGHPYRLTSNPYRPGQEFSCASCHNPHASNASFFLNNFNESMDRSDYCKSCHAYR